MMTGSAAVGNKWQKTWPWLVMIPLGAGLSWVVVYLLQNTPEILAAAIPAAAAVVAVVVGRRSEKRHELERIRRAELRPIYERLIRTFAQFGDGSDDEETSGGELPNEVKDFFRDLHVSLLLSAPSTVIQAWNDWQRSTTGGSTTAPLAAYANLLTTIRKDLGHKDGDLPPTEILRIFVNDIDEIGWPPTPESADAVDDVPSP